MQAVATVRTDLATHFRAQASYRRDIAETRCFRDSWKVIKNEIYAESLEEVAEYVESLADDDPVLMKLMAEPYGWRSGPEEMHTFTIHCDFREMGIARWLDLWVESAIECAREED